MTWTCWRRQAYSKIYRLIHHYQVIVSNQEVRSSIRIMLMFKPSMYRKFLEQHLPQLKGSVFGSCPRGYINFTFETWPSEAKAEDVEETALAASAVPTWDLTDLTAVNVGPQRQYAGHVSRRFYDPFLHTSLPAHILECRIATTTWSYCHTCTQLCSHLMGVMRIDQWIWGYPFSRLTYTML